jgi:hypothetical protein
VLTVLGLVFLAATAWVLMFRPGGTAWLFSAAIAFPLSAAVVVAGNGVSPFYCLAVLCVLALLPRRGRSKDRSAGPTPGRTALIWFAAWGVIVTIVSPTLFRGIDVLVPRDGIDRGVRAPGELAYTISNLAQAGYVVLAVLVVLYLGRRRGVSPHTLTLGLGLGTVLSTVRLATVKLGLPWPAELFDNAPNIAYLNSAYGGATRLRGIFAEASELSGFTIMALAYFVSMAWNQRGRVRAGYVALAGLAALNLSSSYSGTAVVGMLLVCGVAGVVLVLRMLSGSFGAAPFLSIAGLLAAAALVVFGGALVEQLGELVGGKVDSSSFENRTAADMFTLRLLGETYGLGAGLGSNRSSSLGPMFLGTVGVVGTVLFAVGAITVLRRAWRRPEWRPTAWALIALVLARSVAGPEISSPWIWLCLALCANAAWVTGPEPQRAQRRGGAVVRPAAGRRRTRALAASR